MLNEIIRWFAAVLLPPLTLIATIGCSSDDEVPSEPPVKPAQVIQQDGSNDTDSNSPTTPDSSDTDSEDLAACDNSEAIHETVPPATIEELVEVFDADEYRFGVDVEQMESRWREKVQTFSRQAKSSDPIALASLYFCYSKGIGTEKDDDRAFGYAKSAANPRPPQNTTHAAGKHVLGDAYISGIGVVKNEAVGMQLIEEAAERGFPLSKFEAGREIVKRALSGERLSQEERDSCIRLLTQAHKAGVLKAKTLLGQLYLKGILIERPNLIQGLALIEEAASAGHAHAQNIAFTVYQIGAPPQVPKDLQLARKFLEQAAAAGHAESQFQLAAAYLQHERLTVELGLSKDNQEAFKWGTLSAAQDHPRGHFLLSVMHEFGHAPGGQNETLAREHLDKAVELKEPGAIARKGNALVIGELYKRDVALGLSMLREAAALGNEYAIETLKHIE